MKNLKKVLACLLVAAMTLTCFVGALTVSADGTGTIIAGNVEVASDATSVVVPVTINADAALNAAKITVAAEGYTVDDIAVASGDAYIDEEDVNGGTFLIQAKDNVAGFAAAVVNVTFAADAAVAADVVITLDEVHAATWAEEVVDLAITNGAITVKAPAPVEPTLDASVTMSKMLYYSDKIGLVLYIKPGEYNTKYADYNIVAEFSKYDAQYNSYDTSRTYLSSEKTVKNGNEYFYFTELAAYEIANNVKFTLNLLDAEGNVVAYNVLETSIVDQALYELVTYSPYGAALKNACTSYVDMLNYAAAAQDYFAAEGSDLAADIAANGLANAGCEQKYQDAYASTKADLPAEYNTTNKASVKNIINANLKIEASNSIFYKFSNISAYNAEDLKLYVSYTNAYGNPVEGAFDLEYNESVSAYTAKFSQVALYDLPKTVTAVLKNGDDVIVTHEYCLETDIKMYFDYAAYSPDLAALGELGETIVLFSRSAAKSLGLTI